MMLSMKKTSVPTQRPSSRQCPSTIRHRDGAEWNELFNSSQKWRFLWRFLRLKNANKTSSLAGLSRSAARRSQLLLAVTYLNVHLVLADSKLPQLDLGRGPS